jgi:hypothetical protein
VQNSTGNVVGIKEFARRMNDSARQILAEQRGACEQATPVREKSKEEAPEEQLLADACSG